MEIGRIAGRENSTCTCTVILFCYFKFHLSFNTGTLLSYLLVTVINYNLKIGEAAESSSVANEPNGTVTVTTTNQPNLSGGVMPCALSSIKSSGRRTYVCTYVRT